MSQDDAYFHIHQHDPKVLDEKVEKVFDKEVNKVFDKKVDRVLDKKVDKVLDKKVDKELQESRQGVGQETKALQGKGGLVRETFALGGKV